MLHQPIDLINPAPQEQWWQKPRFQRFAGNALQDLGLGLASGTNISDAFGNAAQVQAQRQPARDAYEAGLQEKQARQEQITKTMEWVQKNAPQYLGDIQAGVTTAADVWARRAELLNRTKQVEQSYLYEPNLGWHEQYGQKADMDYARLTGGAS